ncbi:RsmB/NOP family class I SAM-dependent RNA methyltransferase [Halogranum rubrum]|uniref:Nol1/nop2/sun family RNA methylase n=1 Tax=Halogranum salarium B-1 TaxID=1210908 RepID=J2ZKA4_9EURY|nr:RsmB/NOP family class I SAM-dependent RNA methyltransferase [Halogranum salarium]EJN61155.1 nol1/nop2/sun family RNA methylase [Halogranum salarium B-1]
MNPLQRYLPLVDDEEAFLEACDRPLPYSVRVNTIKATVERATEALDDEGVGYEQTDWNPEILRLTEGKAGTTWPYFHGWLHGQEEVSALPAIALDPQPGETVWDTCAAPGSKSTQLSALMDDEGFVVANDNSLGRLSALRHNAERLGVTNVAVTNKDARNFSLKPFDFDQFDRTLVDAPCSCEGTCRKNPDALEKWTMDHVHSVVGIQKGIIRRAIQATRPGGTVVYSTCTFAPEENEAIVNHALETEDCEVVEFDTPLETSPGITEWEDEEYHPSVEKTHRVYPHQNDTGGFFCAKLQVGGVAESEEGEA